MATAIQFLLFFFIIFFYFIFSIQFPQLNWLGEFTGKKKKKPKWKEDFAAALLVIWLGLAVAFV